MSVSLILLCITVWWYTTFVLLVIFFIGKNAPQNHDLLQHTCIITQYLYTKHTSMWIINSSFLASKKNMHPKPKNIKVLQFDIKNIIIPTIKLYSEKHEDYPPWSWIKLRSSFILVKCVSKNENLSKVTFF